MDGSPTRSGVERDPRSPMVDLVQASAPQVASSLTHAVGFYDDDRECVEVIATFVQDGWSLGEAVILVATRDHREALHAVLRARGVDLDGVVARGLLVEGDSAALLASLHRDGSLDPERFERQVGALVAGAAQGGRAVRVYGEMVNQLWREGRVAHALQLEGFWNELAKRHEFSLLCGYSTDALRTAGLTEVAHVCDLHAQVVPPTGYDATAPSASSADPDLRSVIFLPVPQAVAAVRRFIRAALNDWHDQAALTDATLAISEMATNAVLHAHSPFRVLVQRRPAGVLVAVEDVGAGRARQRVAETTASGGRGLAIVQAVADRWGTDPLERGNVVWAEFDLAQQLSPALASAPGLPD